MNKLFVFLLISPSLHGAATFATNQTQPIPPSLQAIERAVAAVWPNTPKHAQKAIAQMTWAALMKQPQVTNDVNGLCALMSQIKVNNS
jgi:hypothetical protein